MNLLSKLTSVSGEAARKTTLPVKTKDLNLTGKVPNPIAESVVSVVNEITDYLKIAEIETTKRTEIIAQRDIALATIQAQRENISKLLTYTFQERAAVIQKQFETLDKAIANGDTVLASHSLNAMVSVIQSSPFKTVQEMQALLGNKDFVVRFE
jgi:hypothetical protein